MSYIFTCSHLVSARIGGKRELLSSEAHTEYIQKKLNKMSDKFRPDIVHRCVLAIFDSPLSKANIIDTYIRTTDKKIIRIDQTMRVEVCHSDSA